MGKPISPVATRTGTQPLDNELHHGIGALPLEATQATTVDSETLVRPTLPALVAFTLLAAGGLAQAQEATPADLIDPEIPQQERICDVEIDEVEAILDENLDSFEELEQQRLRTQLDEARAFCDDGNEVMAAIRLEAVTAVVEVTAGAD